MQFRDFLPLMFPVGFWLGLYIGKKQGQLQERRAHLLTHINDAKKRMDDLIKKFAPPPGMMRGPTLMFDHDPTDEEIQEQINQLTRGNPQGITPADIESFGPMASELKTGQPNMPQDRKQAINADFESSDIFKSLKNLDNE